MSQRTLQWLIGILLIIIVIVMLAFQGICESRKNIVSSSVSGFVQTPQSPMQNSNSADPLSYDGIIKVLIRWAYAHCSS